MRAPKTCVLFSAICIAAPDCRTAVLDFCQEKDCINMSISAIIENLELQAILENCVSEASTVLNNIIEVEADLETNLESEYDYEPFAETLLDLLEEQANESFEIIAGRAVAFDAEAKVEEQQFSFPGQFPFLGQFPFPGQPPGQTPPGQRPPGQRPPGQRPPGQTPPGQRPPGQRPPGQRPPGQTPPGQRPPGQRPPGQRPPGQRPPGQRPPGQRPPGQRPPGQRPPGQRPPGQRPPGQRPPGQRPPGQRPPGQRPPQRPPQTYWPQPYYPQPPRPQPNSQRAVTLRNTSDTRVWFAIGFSAQDGSPRSSGWYEVTPRSTKRVSLQGKRGPIYCHAANRQYPVLRGNDVRCVRNNLLPFDSVPYYVCRGFVPTPGYTSAGFSRANQNSNGQLVCRV